MKGWNSLQFLAEVLPLFGPFCKKNKKLKDAKGQYGKFQRAKLKCYNTICVTIQSHTHTD